MKRLIAFDLDGTLAESKSPLDAEMCVLLAQLLTVVRVAVISGASWAQFEKQVLTHVPPDAKLQNFFILPTCGAQFYSYAQGWNALYREDFSPEEKSRIINALRNALAAAGLEPAQKWGDLIEDRGSQITLSALGQEAPLEVKKLWDPDFSKRRTIKLMLDGAIPEFSVQLGGATSIDITRPGVDKGYGVRKLQQTLVVRLGDMLFVGDAIFPGGNDWPAKQTGVACIRVRDPEETKRIIETVIACVDSEEGGCRPSN